MPLSLIPTLLNIDKITNNAVKNVARSISQDKGNLTLAVINAGNSTLSETINRLGAGVGSPLNGITGAVNPGNLSNLSNPVQNFVQNGVGSLSENVGSFGQATSSTVQNIASGGLQKVTSNLGQSQIDFKSIQNLATDLISAARSKNIPSAETLLLGEPESIVAVYPSTGGDWRIKLGSPFGIITWPTTPTFSLSTRANYNSQDIVHANYPHPVYKNSASDDIQISGEWPVETDADAQEWLTAITIGRALTKMDFAGSGAPPVICTLYGLGSVLNYIPVVVKSFQVDFKDDVHYINTGGGNVPRLSSISATLMPIYSRASQRQFNLDAYAAGAGNIPF